MLTRAIQGEEEERRRNRLLSTGLGGRDSVRPSVSRQMTMIEARLSISDPTAQPASAIDHALSAATSPSARSPVIQARDSQDTTSQDRTSQDRTRVVRGPMPSCVRPTDHAQRRPAAVSGPAGRGRPRTALGVRRQDRQPRAGPVP